ncbi:MAG: glycosyltransferase family 39 protein, partial [Chloroflexi bacterium]|nr:glycosyltransferase family 39 protein [Chloroflexota bacterium]
MDITQEISDTPNARKAFSALRQETLVVTAVLAILAVALGLRLYGLNWDEGFAWTPHPDERAILARVDTISPPPIGDLGVLLDADESPWNPRWFPYGSFPLYLMKGAQFVASIGSGDEVRDLRLIGRAISALADVVTVLMVFVLGSRVYGRRVGLLASAFAALAVIQIQLSHFFAVDTLLALFTIVSFYFMYRVAREGRPRDSMLAGVFIGLGLATKVSQGPILGAFVVAHLMYAFAALRDADTTPQSFTQRWSTAVKGASLGIGVSLAIFFVAQPYAFLDWSRFLGDVTEQSEMVRRIRDYPYTRQYIDTTPYLYQMRQLATWGLGWPLGIVAWAGLLYASLRGMRLKYGLAYLGVGWILPAAILLFSASFFAIFVASGIALFALLGTLPVRSQDSRADVLLLSWVVPYFLITGALQVKFMRYLIPITPFLLLFGSRMLFALWDRFGGLRSGARRWMAVGLAMLVGVTGFYAISYVGIYSETHTAVRAADWINQNAPKGSVILKEHWEEGLPNMSGYDVRELPLYDDDTAQKSRLIAGELAEADYLVFFSNRLYGTIPRLPERYPFSREYYRLLFNGQLGYELADFEATYPEFLGVSFVDDTFGRPDIPEPIALREFQPSPVTLNLGFADESFSVYDHPKVLIFENVERLSASVIRSLFRDSAPSDSLPQPQAASARSVGLMLSPQDAEAQQQGGTWSDIIRSDSWTNRFPVLAWLVVVEGISLLALPLTLLVFRPLPDRGYLFSKALGLLIVSLIVWLLASVQWMAFSRGSISLALVLLALASGVAIARRRRELAAFVRERWSLLLIGEIVFLTAFFAFLLIRMANPDLWHPFRGGEKPMDMAYLNAVLRSSYMPPFDPWFGGGYINYYYWGQFIVATLIKATGIEPSIAFNLAVPLFFALTVAGAFALVYNLAESTRRASVRPQRQWLNQGLRWSPVLAGIGGALFVTVLGNLDGAVQVGQGVWRAMFQNAPFGEFDFWRSSRMMAPDPPGHEITEFPFFTFLFADLHAHMIAIPFTLLALGLGISVFFRILSAKAGHFEQWSGVIFLGLAVGALRIINAWDWPTYLALAGGAILAGHLIASNAPLQKRLIKGAAMGVVTIGVSHLAYLPFHVNFELFNDGIGRSEFQTPLWRYWYVHAPFILLILSYIAWQAWAAV